MIQRIDGTPDYIDIIDLLRAEWPPEFGASTTETIIAHYREHHNERTDTVKYLIEKGHIIGFYRYTLWPRDEPSANTAHTLDLAILPSHQKKGLGTLLMKDLIRDCGERGIIRLLSRSYKTNAASIGLHQSLGFSMHRETTDSIVWELNIAAKQ